MYNHKESVKALIRHALFRWGLSDAVQILKSRHSGSVDHKKKGKVNLGEVFSQIYANNLWVERDNQESISGIGSTEIVTNELVDRLGAFLKSVDCQQLVDIGCGDFNWMRKVQGDFKYVGIDVVSKVIDANNAVYGSSRRRFICIDATREAIPPGDVALCRDVLFHLSFQDGLQLLRNVKIEGFKYVLLTNDKSIWFNSDIHSGGFRLINLFKSPYRLPEPQCELADDKLAVERTLTVWRGESLPGD